MKKAKQKINPSANVMLGMAAGAAMSAAGMYYASQNRKETKTMAKKVGKSAETAMANLDKMMMGITKNF